MFILYEQINPDDSFGMMMLKNLQKRKCPLLSLKAYPTLKAQKDRFMKEGGFEKAYAFDLYHIYQNMMPNIEKERAEKIEKFDEYEEWKLLLQHYMILVAFNHLNPFYNNNNPSSSQSEWLKLWLSES